MTFHELLFYCKYPYFVVKALVGYVKLVVEQERFFGEFDRMMNDNKDRRV